MDALQEARTARLDRVSTWVLLGADPAAAAAYEGFDDAPVQTADEQPQAQSLAVGERGRVLSMRAASPSLELWLGGAARAIDPDAPDLDDSAYARPPHAYVAALQGEYPEIWSAGGTERGGEAFEYWTKYQNGDRSESVLAWVVEREAWGARHAEDGDAFVGYSPEQPTLSNIGGVVAWMKWGVVGQLGWDKMKSLIETLKGELDGQDEEKAREAGLVAVWRGWVDEVHEPSEKELALSMRRALKRQSEVIAERLASLEARSLRRDVLDVVLATIFPDSVRSLLAEIARNAMQRAVRVAWGRAAREVGATLDKAAADAAFDSAPVKVRQKMLYPRVHPCPIETCGCVASFDPVRGELTTWLTSQAPHIVQCT